MKDDNMVKEVTQARGKNCTLMWGCKKQSACLSEGECVIGKWVRLGVANKIKVSTMLLCKCMHVANLLMYRHG